jgi:hypothetical protein
LRPALRDLGRHAGATLLAVGGAIAAALVARVAVSGAQAALLHLIADRPLEPSYAGERAILILGSGLVSALLIGVISQAAALCSYGGGKARDGLSRTPALLAIAGLELSLQGTLAVASLLLFVRHLPHSGTAGQLALRATALLAPLLPAALVAFVVARVGQSLVARGLPFGLALIHGCDFTLRRFPSLVRLGLGLLAATMPLWLAAVLLPFPLRTALLALAGLWSYAALIRLVGADARLALG